MVDDITVYWSYSSFDHQLMVSSDREISEVHSQGVDSDGKDTIVNIAPELYPPERKRKLRNFFCKANRYRFYSSKFYRLSIIVLSFLDGMIIIAMLLIEIEAFKVKVCEHFNYIYLSKSWLIFEPFGMSGYCERCYFQFGSWVAEMSSPLEAINGKNSLMKESDRNSFFMFREHLYQLDH